MPSASPRALATESPRSLSSIFRARLIHVLPVLALVVCVAVSGADGSSSGSVAASDLQPVGDTSGGPVGAPAASAAGAKPLAGRTIVLDPAGLVGGGSQVNRRVAAGGMRQACGSVGARTRNGVHEAAITRQTARQLGKLLRRAGAKVVYTRSGLTGPCVDKRARKANTVAADLKLTLDADTANPRKHGFTVAAPTNRAPWTDDIFEQSRRLGTMARDALSSRKLPRATKNGLRFTSRSAALNLSDVPAVEVSLGNLSNADDARRMTTSKGRTDFAKALLKATRAYFNGEPDATGPGAALGVQLFPMWRDWEDREKLMDDVVRAGSQWIRVDVGWCSLEEAGPGIVSTWYQDRLDATVAAARARGLKMILVFTCTPKWGAAGGQENLLPLDPGQYARAAAYLATRYRGQIAAWEVWNEPDCIGGCPNGNPEAYAQLLKVAYPAIKAADPAAVVMSGGLSGINLEWIRRMLAAGAAGSMDAMALHPYISPATEGVTLPSTSGYSNPYRMPNVEAAHAMTAAFGRPDLPIWFTEFGWTTGRQAGDYDGVTPQRQAAYLTEAMSVMRQKYPYVQTAIWYMMRDRTESNIYENGFGLLTTDGSPKPSYAAFAEAAKY